MTLSDAFRAGLLLLFDLLHIRADVVHLRKDLREHALQLGHSAFELLECLKGLLLLLQYVIPIDGDSL